MSTYQDRARKVIEPLLFPESSHGYTLNETGERRVQKALSELASIVEEEIIGRDQDTVYDYQEKEMNPDIPAYWRDDDAVSKNELRQEQRDQLKQSKEIL